MRGVFIKEETNSIHFRELPQRRAKKFSAGSVLLGLFVVLSFLGCSKTKVLDDVTMDQVFSLPLGEKELSIEEPPLQASTNRPGPFGTFYYNGRPFPVVNFFFHKESGLDFAMDSIKRLNWIQQLDFKIRVKNTFPSVAYFQVYLLDAGHHITDSVFVSGKQTALAGEVNSLDEVKDTAVSVFEKTFDGERLNRLKHAKFLSYHMFLATKQEDGKELRFTNQSNVRINLAMRLYLKYNINELEWVKF
jgi:hypothetical protein